MSEPSPKKLRIGISIGDVNGIGPELLIKTFQDQRMRDSCIPILYGSSRALNIYRKVLQISKFNFVVIQKPEQAEAHKLNVIECIPGLEKVEIGVASADGGKAALLSLQQAIGDAVAGELDALVTLPVDKASVQKHEPGFRGHTEMLAEAFGLENSLMFMVSDELRVGLVTNHLPLREVAEALSPEIITAKVRIMHRSLIWDFGISKPLIALLGLNPHAGDNELLGDEERKIISQAITELKKDDIRVMGAYPSDGFFGSGTYRKFDGIMAMYHDQGLIPFKLLAGYDGVNFTAGLPIVRTSPDHGVAYDIAGKNIANASSLRQSIFTTIDIIRNRKMNEELTADVLPTTVRKGERR